MSRKINARICTNESNIVKNSISNILGNMEDVTKALGYFESIWLFVAVYKYPKL